MRPARETEWCGARKGGRVAVGRTLAQRAAQRVQGGHLQRLAALEVGQQRAEGARQHRLAASRWADHQQVVAACGGDLQGSLGLLLATHRVEVGELLDGSHLPCRCARQASAAVEVTHAPRQRPDADHLE